MALTDNPIERRSVPGIEVRVEGPTANPRITWYPAVFNQPSEDLGGFTERIQRGAFSKSLLEANIVALFNHNYDSVLGRNKSGTLSLREDDHGLLAQVRPPDTQWARDLIKSIGRKDIEAGSIGFRIVKEQWGTKGADVLRTLQEVALMDVSIVTAPAYAGTAGSTVVSERALIEARHMRGGGPRLTHAERAALLDSLDDQPRLPDPIEPARRKFWIF